MDVRDAERAFVNKLGATRDDSGDHVIFYYDIQGSKHRVGKLSHSWRGQLNDTQLGMLSRYLGLKKQEFQKWVTCTLDNESMIAIWRTNKPLM